MFREDLCKNRFELQDESYAFPYHYVSELTPDGRIVIYRLLGWGLMFLTYTLYIRDRICAMQPESILDVGCGDGRLLYMLPDIPCRVGIDLSQKAIAFARAFDPNVDWYSCSLDKVPGRYANKSVCSPAISTSIAFDLEDTQELWILCYPHGWSALNRHSFGA